LTAKLLFLAVSFGASVDCDENINQVHAFVTPGFSRRFSELANKLMLADYFTCSELSALRSAAFYAALCRIAFNGLGGCGGVIKPQLEPNRTRLERRFMVERDKVLTSNGWRQLPKFTRDTAEAILLSVSINEGNFEKLIRNCKNAHRQTPVQLSIGRYPPSGTRWSP
jgi:hypothetical protein